MSTETKSRRDFLGITAMGVAGAVVIPRLSGRTETRANSKWEIKLGVASYSLREFSRADAIKMILELRTPYVNIKSFHLPYENSPEELAAGRREFEEAGLQIVGGGNNNIIEDTDEHVRMFFEYAKMSGMPLLVIAPKPEILPRIEKFVKQYNIKVAIHNHGPEDKYFPAPRDALKLIKNMDPRVGLCIDIGHTTRTGADVVQEIAEAGNRVLDMHIKDLKDLMVKESQCIVGEGAMPIPEIFAQLQKMKYAGYANLEYEIDKDNPLPGMKQSFAYMRGVLAGLAM
ncbi:sugar phosphate isomerase/epimerase [candidate division KSB1 bacterium]|nr:sugar phosphate isomerase/epimerase [candidate division KSB1 bacterium]